MVGFAGNSAFWLALAFLMSAQAYGELMTVQAAVLLVVSGLTFRTHDLFFNLLTQQARTPDQVYGITRRSELASAMLASAIVMVGAGAILLPHGQLVPFAITAGYAVLAAWGANQGAAIARLRQASRGDIIARTDVVASVLWGLAILAAIFLLRVHPLLPLLLGAAPPFARSCLLARSARRFAPDDGTKSHFTNQERRNVARFLLGAQLTNFLKNGAVSIETVILAAFAPPPLVAMYRVARGVLGIAVAALNVAYQRVYPVLARARSKAEFRAAVASLERRSLLICLVTYPLSAGTALAYAWLKPGVAILELELLTLATFVASLPAALQQGAFAILSLRGQHRSANLAYIVWFAVLGAGSSVLIWVPRIEVFMAALILAGLARFGYLRRCAHAAPGPIDPPAQPAAPEPPDPAATKGAFLPVSPSAATNSRSAPDD